MATRQSAVSSELTGVQTSALAPVHAAEKRG
jgi:hypothetical protein